MTEDERSLGRLEAQMEGMETRMDSLEAKVITLGEDVHEIKESVAEMRGHMKLLVGRDQTNAQPIAFAVLLFAGAGMYTGRLSEWGVLISLFIAGVVSQHGSLNKLAATVFRRKDDAHADTPTP